MNDGAGGSPPLSKAAAAKASEQSVTDKKLFKPVRVGSPLVVGVVNTPKVPEREPAQDVAPPRPPSRGLPRSVLASVAVSIVALTTTIIVVALPEKSDERGNSGTEEPLPTPVETAEAQPVKEEPKRSEVALGPTVKDLPRVEPTPEPEPSRVADVGPAVEAAPKRQVALGPTITAPEATRPTASTEELDGVARPSRDSQFRFSDAEAESPILTLNNSERDIRELGLEPEPPVRSKRGAFGRGGLRLDGESPLGQQDQHRGEDISDKKYSGTDRWFFSPDELNRFVLIVAKVRAFDLELKRLAREMRDGEPITQGGFVMLRRAPAEIVDSSLRTSWFQLAEVIDETVANMRDSQCFEQKHFGEALRQIDDPALRAWVSEFISLFKTSSLRAAEIAELKKLSDSKDAAK